MMQVDHHFEENLTPERVDAIIQRLRTEPSPHGAKPEKAAAVAPVPGEKVRSGAEGARSRSKRTQV
jgi:hypothetical protein